jgi:hypothetical protein
MSTPAETASLKGIIEMLVFIGNGIIRQLKGYRGVAGTLCTPICDGIARNINQDHLDSFMIGSNTFAMNFCLAFQLFDEDMRVMTNEQDIAADIFQPKTAQGPFKAFIRGLLFGNVVPQILVALCDLFSTHSI